MVSIMRLSEWWHERTFVVRAVILLTVLVFLLLLVSSISSDGKFSLTEGSQVASEEGYVRVSVRASGMVRSVGQQSVYPKVNGVVSEVYAIAGSAVVRGQRLAELDDYEYMLAYQEAESHLVAAKSDLGGVKARFILAESEYVRAKRLYAADLIPRQELESANAMLMEARSRAEMAEARVVQAEARFVQARRNLDDCVVRSPIDGVVLTNLVEIGAPVSRASGRHMFDVAPSLSNMEIRASVSESDIGQVSEGLTAYFRVEAFPGVEFKGSVSGVNRGGDSRGGVIYYDVTVLVEGQHKNLLPGMTARLDIHSNPVRVDSRIPVRALLYNPNERLRTKWRSELEEIRQRGHTVVWIHDEKDGQRPFGVQLGIQDEEYVEVITDNGRSGIKVLVN